MADPTLEVYQAEAARWAAERRPRDVAAARAFGEQVAVLGLGPAADLGCGPGWNAADLGHGTLALDGARAMLDLVAQRSPGARRVQADLRALPIRGGALGGAWASNSYVHLARAELPLALWDLHRALAVGAPVRLRLFSGDREHGPIGGDDFPGRLFSQWDPEHLAAVVLGAGFVLEHLTEHAARGGKELVVDARRVRTLADTVGPGMRLLVCGLNPSLHAADAGYGYAGPGNRFWPAAVGAGLVEVPRAPRRALAVDGLGMTDLVKRATARAEELSPAEFRTGLDRLERLCSWLQPGAVVMVGLTGWRAAVDPRASPGPQDQALAGRPVYVMPSTSGRNARTSLVELTEHLRAAADLADQPG